MRENVLYTLTCKACQEDNNTLALYTGESSRSGYQRTREHAKGALRGDPRNSLVIHREQHHPSHQGPVPFTVSILRSFKTPLARLIAESVAIEACEAGIVMNSKGEWGSSRIPRLALEVGEVVRQEDYRGTSQASRKISQPQQWRGRSSSSRQGAQGAQTPPKLTSRPSTSSPREVQSEHLNLQADVAPVTIQATPTPTPVPVCTPIHQGGSQSRKRPRGPEGTPGSRMKLLDQLQGRPKVPRVSQQPSHVPRLKTDVKTQPAGRTSSTDQCTPAKRKRNPPSPSLLTRWLLRKGSSP